MNEVKLFTVCYKIDNVTKRGRIFKTLEEVEIFINEIVKKGYELVHVTNYIGKKVII